MLTEINAAVIQLEPFCASSLGEYRDALREPLMLAEKEHLDLVVFPPYIGMALLGMLGEVIPDADFEAAAKALGYASPAACYSEMWETLEAAYVRASAELAAEFGVYLAAGTTLSRDEQGEVYNVAYLFGPDGALLGTQRQTHLGSAERRWGLSRGDTLEVFETEVGRLGFVIGTDVRYPEVSRILCLRGANVLLHLNAQGYYTQADWMRRLWREVQANQVFGLESCLVGKGYRGRATIHAPLEMTSQGNGVLAQAHTDDRAETVMGRLDFKGLQRVIDDYPIYSVLNCRMYEKYFPGLYQSR